MFPGFGGAGGVHICSAVLRGCSITNSTQTKKQSESTPEERERHSTASFLPRPALVHLGRVLSLNRARFAHHCTRTAVCLRSASQWLFFLLLLSDPESVGGMQEEEEEVMEQEEEVTG